MKGFNMYGRQLTVVLSILGACIAKSNLEIMLEREAVTYSDDKYIIVHEHDLSRINRTSVPTYKLNVTLLQPWYNNVTVEMKGFENSNNEYKESILHMNYAMCDMLSSTNFLLRIARRFGNIPLKCPMANNLYVQNFTVRADEIPPYFPQSKWMIQIQVYTAKKKVRMLEFELYFQIKPRMDRRPKKNKATKIST